MKIIVSFFECRACPSAIDGDTSIATMTFSSRSAWVWRTNGAPSRAVTFQSIRRTSSPGRYGRCSSKSKPGAAQRARVGADALVADLPRGVDLDVAQLAHERRGIIEHRLRNRHRGQQLAARMASASTSSACGRARCARCGGAPRRRRSPSRRRAARSRGRAGTR